MTLKNKITTETPNDLKRRWKHPGGKLLELGSEHLSDAELLSIIIGTGIKGKSAEDIAKEILMKFNSFKGMAHQPLDRLLKIKGLGEVKAVRIAALFEIATRIVKKVFEDYEKEN